MTILFPLGNVPVALKDNVPVALKGNGTVSAPQRFDNLKFVTALTGCNVTLLWALFKSTVT